MKILLIEDDHLIAEMYTQTLQQAGHEVATAITGPQALQMIASQPPDLILLDIMIPDKDGIQVLEELHKNLPNPRPKILIMTNFDQDESTREDLESKADGYLVKAEVTPNELLDIIGRL